MQLMWWAEAEWDLLRRMAALHIAGPGISTLVCSASQLPGTAWPESARPGYPCRSQ